ncbi:MAG: nucleoside deaminase [Aliivibrio sp.]|nr:nucleoside deaminase [Aliivibrio sp.]
MHEKYMRIALEEAQVALDKGNIPIGACIVLDGCVISRAHNEVDSSRSDLKHAEMQALTQVDSRLFELSTKVSIYSTLEPCAMCAGAIVNTGIQEIVYGASDSLVGAISVLRTNGYYQTRLVNVVGDVLANESQQLLNQYVDKYGCRKHLKHS